MKDFIIGVSGTRYSSRYYFVWEGMIYMKLSFSQAFERGFKYPVIECVKA